jgi:hypothetical protein
MSKEIFICGRYCFIPSGDIKGMWFRAARCVAYIRCEYCGAEIGEPCSGANGNWNSATHVARRRMYSDLLKKTGDFRKKTAVTVTIEDKIN